MWDRKQKANNEQTKQTNKNSQTQTTNSKVVTAGKGGWGRLKRVKEVKYTVMNGLNFWW